MTSPVLHAVDPPGLKTAVVATAGGGGQRFLFLLYLSYFCIFTLLYKLLPFLYHWKPSEPCSEPIPYLRSSESMKHFENGDKIKSSGM